MTLTDQVRDEVMTLYAAGGNDDYKDDMKSIILIDSLLTAIESQLRAAQDRIRELENENEKEGASKSNRHCNEVNDERTFDGITTVKGFLG